MWESGRYATPGSFGPENAHNNYLQIAAELGLVGFAAFTAVFAAAVSGLRPSLLMNPCRLWIAAGLVVYMGTAVAGHPLLVFEASIPFWIVAGALAPPAALEWQGRAPRVAFAALAAFVVVTFPFRAAASVRALMQAPSAVPWQTDGEVRYRDVADGDTIVISPPTPYISVPLRLAGPGSEATVDVAVDGRTVNSVVVSNARWTDVRVLFPKSPGYEDRRVTLRLRGQEPGSRLLVGRVKLP
jgi:hypothetical protein